MVVSGQDGNTCPGLPIPDPDSLIIRGRDDPGVFSVEEDSSDIVEICNQYHPHLPENRLTAGQGKKTFPLLVIPYFDLVIITTRTEDRLCWVETDSSNRSCWSACALHEEISLAHHRAHRIYPLEFPFGSSIIELYHYVRKQLGGVALGLSLA